MSKEARVKPIKLTDNFYLDEFAASEQYPELASQITFDALEKYKSFFIAKLLLQPVRDKFQCPVAITSGKRSQELNTKIGGSKTSQHVLCEAADWGFLDPTYNNNLLIQAFDFIEVHLQHNWHQVILYITDDYRTRFIHVSIPSYLNSKKPKAMLNFKGRFYIWNATTIKEFYNKIMNTIS